MRKCDLCGKEHEDEIRLNRVEFQRRGGRNYIDLLGRGYYSPRLTLAEKYALHCTGRSHGYICADRAACQRRYEQRLVN
jgi:hypothetical protein